MRVCRVCGQTFEEICESIGVCVNCLRKGNLEFARNSHRKWREEIGLPSDAAEHEKGLKCPLCVNACAIPEGEVGFCGVLRNEGNRLIYITGSHRKALLHWYYDPHPTNCVALPVCPEKDHRGFYNLAVFFAGCNLDCLFCQNIDHKYMVKDGRISEGKVVDLDELIEVAMNPRVSCVCFFGGDPTPWTVFALEFAVKLGNRLRICWETNGLAHPRIMENMAKISLETGGTVKIDWKAFSPTVYEALTGVDGRKAVSRIKENVRLVASMGKGREMPLLVVSVLVIPHYIDEKEIEGIAGFISSVDPEIPFVLLAFAPQHLMSDLSTTRKQHMERVKQKAFEKGLKRVFVENVWLLS